MEIIDNNTIHAHIPALSKTDSADDSLFKQQPKVAGAEKEETQELDIKEEEMSGEKKILFYNRSGKEQIISEKQLPSINIFI